MVACAITPVEPRALPGHDRCTGKTDTACPRIALSAAALDDAGDAACYAGTGALTVRAQKRETALFDEQSAPLRSATEPHRIARLTAKLVAAYARNNPVSPDELCRLTKAVRAKLGKLAARAALRETPAVPIERSVTLETIICLECGLGLMALKHHLAVAHGLTADAYRSRWGLARDYPMLAPVLAVVKSGRARRQAQEKRDKRQSIGPGDHAPGNDQPGNHRPT